MKPQRTSIVIWHDTDGDMPPQGDLVLAQHRNGDHHFAFWRDDADAWDDPDHGFIDKSAIIAWARLPVYESDETTE